ncbi:hypothetical protein [endosymbiont GvMRE of Glomus versiforme]|uniref:hypothetical protein n=1 Tax=endosymbiont GvMRE of Glomus versiforme TaxID=2039283 RepID=UPI000EC47680|nr:hypothetical protein [endosymbiont GvMRE of Glomus versiforme]RHZ35561.1 hypothetical protein GvMRE_IIg16 [endosymbiont GvMRE of Glomus versiforme]
MITCCEIALVLGITNVISLAIFAGYTISMEKRTLKLEKKNGSEQKQIEDLQKSLLAFSKDNDELRKELAKLKRKNHD